MVMQQTPEGIKYDLESNKPDRSYEVKEDGTVIMTEKVTNTVTFQPREFISYHRKYLEGKEVMANKLKPEFKAQIEEDLKETEADIAILKPILEKSEANAKAYYEKLKEEGMVKKLREELAKPKKKRNVAYLYEVYKNFNKEGIYDKYLNEEEKQEWLKIKLELMRNERAGKKAAKRGR